MKAIGVVVCAVALAGCGPHGREAFERVEPASENVNIDGNGAESARVEVEMGAGELRIEPGASKLLEADFRYAPPKLKPEVKYEVRLGRGDLVVRQPSIQVAGFGPHENRWTLRLSDKIPLELRVKVGAGANILKLNGLALRRLNVEMGAGEMDLDLSGPWEKDLDAHVEGGVGQATVRLPQKVGVRVRATGGIGEIKVEGLKKSTGEYWINDAYGKTGTDVRLDISGGVGEIRLIG